MNLNDLDYSYPSDLVATTPSRPSRVVYVPKGQAPQELSIPELLQKPEPGDVWVINQSQVVPARVFSSQNDEILFLNPAGAPGEWEVLFGARDKAIGDTLNLPGDLVATLTQKGLPQRLKLSREITAEYFFKHGEVALPPYIQAARNERHQRVEDPKWYQPAWAKIPGSVAAPTASLHFQQQDLETLKSRGVHVEAITLHVGAGTFLPIRSNNLAEHTMHSEFVQIPHSVIETIQEARAKKRKIWALGTTVTRALESWGNQMLERDADGFSGDTKLFIRPPYQYQVVDRLMTNFHQPKSTLLSLVAAFDNLENVKQVYAWAIERRFKLFSYGDLSVWLR